MSWYANAWAEKAPVVTVYERAILTYLAHRAKKDGTNCYPSTKTLADFALCDKRTVQRHLDAMIERGLIAEGDQRVTEHLPGGRRPTAYDILIPHDWFSSDQLEDVNEERADRGLPPLQPEDRPRLNTSPKSGRSERSDKGKKNSKRRTATSEDTTEPDAGCLSDTPDDPVDNSPRGDSQTPRTPPRGDSQTPRRGDSQTPKTPLGETPPKEETPPEPFGDPQKVPNLQKGYGETAGQSESVVTKQGELVSNQLTARARAKAGQAACQYLEAHPSVSQTDLTAVIRQDQPNLSHGQATGRAATLLTFERPGSGSGAA